MKKISVITANLNNVSTIGNTIGSVVSQSHRPVEMLIVDGGSTDGSAEIIAEAVRDHSDIVSCITDTAPGIYHAINRGIGASTGEIVGLLHGNDRFSSPDILEHVGAAFDDPELDFVFGDIHYVDLKSEKVRRHYRSAGFTREQLNDGFAPPHPSLYVRRDTLDKIGPYREDYVTAADFEMFVRLFTTPQLKWRHLDLDMVEMTLGGASTSLRHRLLTNLFEKRRALLAHGLKPSVSGNLRRIFSNFLELV